MPRLTVVCGCPGAKLEGASAAACSAGKGVRIFDMDAYVHAWINEARTRRPSFSDWNVRADKFEPWLESYPRDFKSLERHARPVTDAITEYVAQMAIDALKTGDVALVGHMSRDDRHSVVALFERYTKPSVDDNMAEALKCAADIADKVANAAADAASKVDHAVKAAASLRQGQYYGRAPATVNLSEISRAVFSAAVSCDAALELLTFSEKAFSDMTTSDTPAACVISEQANRLDPPAPSAATSLPSVSVSKIGIILDHLAQVLNAARSTAQQFLLTSRRSKDRARDVGARAHGEDLTTLVQAALQLVEAAVSVATGKEDESAVIGRASLLKEQVLWGGGSDDDDDEDFDDDDEEAFGKYLEKKHNLSLKDPVKVPESAKVAEPPQLVFVEILSATPCPDYEPLDAAGVNRTSTIDLIGGRHKYAMEKPGGAWVHNLEDHRKAELYGSAVANGIKCVEDARNKADVWKHVESALRRANSGYRTDGYASRRY